MQLVLPSYEIRVPHPGMSVKEYFVDMAKHIEWCGRHAYKSEDKITESSWPRFLKMLMGQKPNKHLSVTEHASISVKFVINRGVSHELVRHRIAAYTQECVGRETKLSNKMRIDMFVEHFKYDDHKDMYIQSVDLSGVASPNKVIDCWYKGEAMVFEVFCGRRRIKATAGTLFRRPDNTYTELKDLKEGDEVLMFGTFRVYSAKIELIDPIGVEDVYDIEMAGPHRNFVANHFVIHNSTRYCNYGKKGVTFILPSEIRQHVDPQEFTWQQFRDSVVLDDFSRTWLEGRLRDEEEYLTTLDLGIKPQRARGCLPNDLKTEVIATFNFREWLHVFEMRACEQAHPDMSELMTPLRKEFATYLPEMFG